MSESYYLRGFADGKQAALDQLDKHIEDVKAYGSRQGAVFDHPLRILQAARRRIEEHAR